MTLRRLARAVPYAVALVGFALAALAAVTAASADAAQRKPRLVPIGSSPGWPYSDGQRLVWATTTGAAEVRDPVTGARHTLMPDQGCRFDRARPRSGTMFTCGSSFENDATRVVVVQTATGATRFDGTVRGRVTHWGDHWIHSYFNAGCYHCDSSHYTNWHTGEERGVDWMDDVPVDLSSPDLRAARPSPRADRARARLVRGRSAVVLVRGGERRTLGRCRAGCSSLALWRGRASWVDNPGKVGVPGSLTEVDLRSGRRWQWPLEPSVRARDQVMGQISHRTMRVGGALVVVTWFQYREVPQRVRRAVR